MYNRERVVLVKQLIELAQNGLALLVMIDVFWLRLLLQTSSLYTKRGKQTGLLLNRDRCHLCERLS